MEKKNEREILPDLLRGFAIILVVLGHCIQEGSGEAYRAEQQYFGDRLYQFIYSFHMPLFMMISGYLSWRGLNKCKEKSERTGLLKKRAVSLLVPVFAWTALDYLRIVFINYLHDKPQPEAFVFVYFYNALNNLWFLWAVWWCFLIVFLMHYFFRDSVIVYILGFLALFVIPDGLGLGAYKYMLPYFLFGYYMHGCMWDKGWNLTVRPRCWLFVVTGLAFVGLFIYYNEDCFIYLTGYKLVGKQIGKQLWIDLYRFFVGFFGSLFFVFVWQYIAACLNKTKIELKMLRRLGMDSMGIYILSGYLLIFVIQRLDFMNRPSYVLNVLEAIVVLTLSWMATILFERVPILKRLVGGVK